MPTQSQGGIKTEMQADGTLAFRLRFRAYGKRRTTYLHERRDCDCIYKCGGGWNERTAAIELDNILARVKAGVWQPPKRPTRLSKPVETEAPFFHPYSSNWLREKIDGVLGEAPIEKNTESDYRWRIECWLLPFFAEYRVDEIDDKLCQAFKGYLVRKSRELRQALDAGADIRDQRNRRRVPLGPASFSKIIDMLAMILDEVVEDRYLDSNPARSKRMRIKVPKPKRTFLEIDELTALIDAAAAQDTSLDQIPAASDLGLTAMMVTQLFAQGRKPIQIAKQLGLAKSTVNYHLSRQGLTAGRGYVGRRAVVEILGRAGLRVSELSDLKIGEVRLHDPEGARLKIPDAKTETGVRDVEISLDLVEALVEHLDRLQRMGAPTGPDDYLIPNSRGRRMSRQRVGEIVADAAKEASNRLTAMGMPPLPNTTPHTLRRTYISIQLLANNFDIKYVMDQVGHADSTMTMDVYAQLQQRAKRDGGEKFDRLIRDARKELNKDSKSFSAQPTGTSTGTEWQKTPPSDQNQPVRKPKKSASEQVKSPTQDPPLEQEITRFSVVCSTN
jgi:integrase